MADGGETISKQAPSNSEQIPSNSKQVPQNSKQAPSNSKQTEEEEVTTRNNEVEKTCPTANNMQAKEEEEEEEGSCSRKRPRESGCYKEGKVSEDKLLMDVGWEVGEKWEEVGVALGLEYKVLQSVVRSQHQGKPDHMKAFHMLREWKRRRAYRATYTELGQALEECGLNSCAEEYCQQQQ